MLKKSASILMATMITFGAMAGQAEAKSNILNDIIDAILTPSGSSSGSSTRTNDFTPSAKRVTLPLDGTYSTVYFPSGIFKTNNIVARHYFELDKPAEVDFHFIGHTDIQYINYIYDADSNKLGDRIYFRDYTDDRNIVLKPGRYVIETSIDIFLREKNDVDFEVKGIKHDLYPNTTSLGYRRHDANVLYYNTEIVDYFSYATPEEQDAKYYKFVLQYPAQIKLMLDKLSKNCNIVICLLDEDESEINYWNGISDEHFEKNLNLNAGTYYLKIKRGSKRGAAYSIRIK